MVFLVFCILVLGAVYLLWRLGARPAGRRYGWRHLWRAACLVGFARIGALWLGVAAFQRSGWPQFPGYFLQMLALPEIYLMRGIRGHPLKWAVAASVLLAATSFLWAALLVWMANRARVVKPEIE
jgi:hypothetical protein